MTSAQPLSIYPDLAGQGRVGSLETGWYLQELHGQHIVLISTDGSVYIPPLQDDVNEFHGLRATLHGKQMMRVYQSVNVNEQILNS